ncbi:FAD assembly factor SdhE [Kangiella geojedonensis]|uniref:FAD assembly factor SdhE n=1 Tax=Kangiella geojedonensis TaxID=914150 RepID=A0A0F6TR63_9GAMM|nr:succinate dehydrogenase assembly factor 2 [Kangiella geojedonensis]AKE52579.1 YgfY [Kangiella geojedonensis]
MTEQELKKLQWASRRGMLELDVVLLPYLEQKGADFSSSELAQYQQFLEETDPDLYAWIMGFETPKDEYAELVGSIKQFVEQQIK